MGMCVIYRSECLHITSADINFSGVVLWPFTGDFLSSGLFKLSRETRYQQLRSKRQRQNWIGDKISEQDWTWWKYAAHVRVYLCMHELTCSSRQPPPRPNKEYYISQYVPFLFQYASQYFLRTWRTFRKKKKFCHGKKIQDPTLLTN